MEAFAIAIQLKSICNTALTHCAGAWQFSCAALCMTFLIIVSHFKK